jgi:hypothetical protein
VVFSLGVLSAGLIFDLLFSCPLGLDIATKSSCLIPQLAHGQTPVLFSVFHSGLKIRPCRSSVPAQVPPAAGLPSSSVSASQGTQCSTQRLLASVAWIGLDFSWVP